MYRVFAIYDNPKYNDRYTVYLDGPGVISNEGRYYVAMNESGMVYHGFAWPDNEVANGGVEIDYSQLPVECQRAVDIELLDMR